MIRIKTISFLKNHPFWINTVWKILGFLLKIWSFFIPIQEKTMIFASFGGRKFDDSPKAIYDEICSRPQFDDWRLIWAFVEPKNFTLKRGEKVKIDTVSFFKALLCSHVWVSNSGMDRGIELEKKDVIKVETWHGTPLKKIGGEENQNALGGKKLKSNKKLDSKTIRCAQSEFDRRIFSRIFNSTKESILLSDLPRNDKLLKYTLEECKEVKRKLGIDECKKVILYAPTYREYLINGSRDIYISFPIDFQKWNKLLGDKYVFLIRTHYAVSAALKIQKSSFIKDVSNYPILNDLYAVADILISDYSSSFFDYSILEKPMFCFAYDLQEYKKKRGLYLDLEKVLPCPVDQNEDMLIERILLLEKESKTVKDKVIKFRKKFVPNPGYASQIVVDEIEKRLKLKTKIR